jgi:hypothetical protein
MSLAAGRVKPLGSDGGAGAAGWAETGVAAASLGNFLVAACMVGAVGGPGGVLSRTSRPLGGTFGLDPIGSAQAEMSGKRGESMWFETCGHWT